MPGRAGRADGPALERERAVRILTGGIALILFAGAVFIGVKATNGRAYRSFYRLTASFDTAGQGLAFQSDVKIHGVTIGQVKSVKLSGGRALVAMEIDEGQDVPVKSRAVVRPKTLFGEKFVDIEPGDAAQETSGPFLPPGGVIADTVGGVELEAVLSAAYPLLRDLRPEDLTVVLDTLASAGAGEGPALNRQLGNFAQLAEVGARHHLDAQMLLSDLALLTDTVARDSPDVLALASSLNVVLPQVNQRGDEVTRILGNLSRVSNDVANLLDANRPAQDKLIVEGGQVLNVLMPRLNEVDPTIVGIRQFVQVLAEIGHIPYGPGTVLGAIKLVLGGGCPFGQVSPCSPTATDAGTPSRAGPAAAAGKAPAPAAAAAAPALGSGRPAPGPQKVTGATALFNLIGGLLR